MTSPQTQVLQLDETSEAEIKKVLLGRRIVKVEEGNFSVEQDGYWSTPITGKLTLDNGTEIYVAPNQGGCACSAGDYELTALATVDNAISDVELRETHVDQGYGEGPTTYGIYVVADAHEVGAVIIDGDDGNGYYGTGYRLTVILPDNAEPGSPALG